MKHLYFDNNYYFITRFTCSYKQAAAKYGKKEVEDMILSVEGLDLENRTNMEKLFKSIKAH